MPSYDLTAVELAEVLSRAGLGRGTSRAADYVRLCPLAGINTRLRWGHFLAQVAIETDRFRTATEYASGRDYEGRRDLGNTQPGDGVRFKGHGDIQTTGRANHRRVTKVLRAGFAGVPADPDCPDFEREPARLATSPYNVLSALVYWHDKNLNTWAEKGDDVDDVNAISRGVNRGSTTTSKRANHEAERVAAFRAIMQYLPKR